MLNILITGAASGIGKAVKEMFLKNNHFVYALDINNIENEKNLKTFKCDITNEANLREIKAYFIKNNIKLDIILNIAGIHTMASLIESDYQQIKKIIDINLCGTILVNNIFHSVLKEKGRIVIITSEVANFDPMPFNGIYSVSKTALESYAQALRQELNLLNQKVITIRPGAIETPLSNGSIKSTNDLVEKTVIFKKQATKFNKIILKFMGKPMKPEKLAKFIYKVTMKKHPKISYAKHQNLGLLLLNILPKKMQCNIIKSLLK